LRLRSFVVLRKLLELELMGENSREKALGLMRRSDELHERSADIDVRIDSMDTLGILRLAKSK
jgi:hypothetical protein